MIPPYWQYYASIEQDLIGASRFVEFARANRDTFSIEFARILFAAASEVDVVAKAICGRIDPSSKPNSIDAYRPIILGKFSRLSYSHIPVPRYNFVLTPWSSWRDGKTPSWWASYNAVKHHRNVSFHQATLRNALNPTAGLLVLLLHLYQLEYGVGVELVPLPQLLIPDGFLHDVTMREQKCYWRIPIYDDDRYWNEEGEAAIDLDWSSEG